MILLGCYKKPFSINYPSNLEEWYPLFCGSSRFFLSRRASKKKDKELLTIAPVEEKEMLEEKDTRYMTMRKQVMLFFS